MDIVEELLNFSNQEPVRNECANDNGLQEQQYDAVINETYDEMLEQEEENQIKKLKIKCFNCAFVFDGIEMELQVRGSEGDEEFVWHCQNCVVEEE